MLRNDASRAYREPKKRSMAVMSVACLAQEQANFAGMIIKLRVEIGYLTNLIY